MKQMSVEKLWNDICGVGEIEIEHMFHDRIISRDLRSAHSPNMTPRAISIPGVD